MFDFLRELFGSANQPAPPVVQARAGAADDVARRSRSVAPRSSDDKRQIIVRREAVLDLSEKIAGYEFSLLTSLQTRLQRRAGMARRAYDAALLRRMSLSGATPLLAHRLSFVNLLVESLDDQLLDALPPQNTVLIFDPPQPDCNWSELMTRIAAFMAKGFSCGLRIYDAAAVNCPLIGNVDYIQIDITAFDALDLRALVRELRARDAPGRPAVRLVARGVPSHDDFKFCKTCHFDLFQGPFLSSREGLQPGVGGISHAIIFPILNMLRSDANFSMIADQLKHEPILTYKLLRYLHSPALGLRHSIDNLTEALILLGRETFGRWVSLLLFDFSSAGYRERALTESALARALTLERLAGKGRVPAAPDHLFLLGLFSLLGVVVGQPLPELLQKVTLPQPVRDALLGAPGALADALALVVLGEADSHALPEQMAQALERCGLQDEDYAPIATEALVLAHQTIGDAS